MYTDIDTHGQVSGVPGPAPPSMVCGGGGCQVRAHNLRDVAFSDLAISKVPQSSGWPLTGTICVTHFWHLTLATTSQKHANSHTDGAILLTLVVTVVSNFLCGAVFPAKRL